MSMTEKLLQLFSTGYSQGAALGTEQYQRDQNLAQAEKEFQAQQAAQELRNKLAMTQEARDAESFKLRTQAQKQGLALGDIQLKSAEEQFANRDKIAAAQAEEAERKRKMEDVKFGLMTEKEKAQISKLKAEASSLREKDKILKQSAKSKEQASAAIGALAEVGGLIRASDLKGVGGSAKMKSAVRKYEKVLEASGEKLDSDRLKRLRAATDVIAEGAAASSNLERKFADVSKITGKDNISEALKTAAGRLDIVKAISSDVGVNRRKLDDLNAGLRIMAIAAQKSEPNSKPAQELIQARYHIKEYTSEEELQTVLSEILEDFNTRMSGARSELESYPGLIQAETAPARQPVSSGRGPANFNVVGGE
jgi:hypothetical protein